MLLSSRRPRSQILVFLRRALVVSAFLFAALQSSAGALALERLTIVTATGEHEFSIEVAATMEQRRKGLMFRKSMADDHGMVFDFGVEDIVMMWMKNTYIPLDMIFVSRKGVVVSVAENAEPRSERTISSGSPAYAVIELKGGAARKIGLAAGDRVRHRIFAQ